MCTGFIKKGEDLILGFNTDLAEGVWDYRVYARPDMFYVGIKVGSTVYKCHGVNKNGNFGNLPYMNDPAKGVYRRGKDYQRIDLLVNDYIAGKRSLAGIQAVAAEKEIVNIPGASMHALLCDHAGNALLMEPGIGCREIEDDYAVISNFPLLEEVEDLSKAWYGKNRYDKGTAVLRSSGAAFSAMDGMRLLETLKQEGEWATRVSFVYSRNENAVYYALNNDFANMQKHVFKQ